MNFVIPRNNESELLLYIWKIINFPKISKKNLLYKISFELFLLTPKKAEMLIESGLKNNLITKNEESIISLSESLEKELINWNQKRKREIKSNINKKKELVQKRESTIKSPFGTILKALSDKGALNRAVSISNDAVEFLEINFNNGIVKAQITGTKENPYNIYIDINKCILSHDCHDFTSRKSKEKKFCKHIIKLFLILKEKNEASTISFLEKILNNINEWDFTG
ncbi:MAG: hypothetical protein ACFFBP_02105 [Promethearchaeota archaeon]